MIHNVITIIKFIILLIIVFNLRVKN